MDKATIKRLERLVEEGNDFELADFVRLYIEEILFALYEELDKS